MKTFVSTSVMTLIVAGTVSAFAMGSDQNAFECGQYQMQDSAGEACELVTQKDRMVGIMAEQIGHFTGAGFADTAGPDEADRVSLAASAEAELCGAPRKDS